MMMIFDDDDIRGVGAPCRGFPLPAVTAAGSETQHFTSKRMISREKKLSRADCHFQNFTSLSAEFAE